MTVQIMKLIYQKERNYILTNNSHKQGHMINSL